jgi:hypothetical protein
MELDGRWENISCRESKMSCDLQREDELVVEVNPWTMAEADLQLYEKQGET